jgi:hypothetical protein
MRRGKLIVLWAGDNGRTIGPIMNNCDFLRVRAFAGHQAFLHGVAQGNDAIGMSHQELIDPLQTTVHRLVVKVLQEHSDFGKNILTEKDKLRSGAPCRE